MVQQQEVVLSIWDLECQKDNTQTSFKLQSSELEDTPWTFSFETIRSNLFHTTFTSKHHPLSPVPNAQVPEVRLDNVQSTVQDSEKSRAIHINDLDVEITWSHTPSISLKWDGSLTYLHQDLDRRSYIVDGTGAAHYSVYNKGSLHVGLGEKAAPMDLSGRSFVMSATDCFGYDVYRTDPMYKHIPLLINATPEGCVGIFSTSHARGGWSVGAEMDGMWGPFKVYRQDHGGLEEYLIVGKNLQEIVRTYADIVGYPKLVPRWGFGYLAGGMKYSMLDEPRAVDAFMDFADKLKHHDIPCSGFQMSSGYTVAETEPKTRNVFTWNKHRFPDPEKFIKDYHNLGIRLIMNVKPYVLDSHPEYRKLVDSGALFTDNRTKESAVARLWSAGGGTSGDGGHIDFTSESGFKWWYEGVKSLRKIGVDCIWNDNNEYLIPNDGWECALTYQSSNFANHGQTSDKSVGVWGRALQTELMAQSSHAALSDLDPNLRPFILTRSATPGTMRFANTTWSGDNVTSWDGMKGSVSLSLNSGLSLLQVSGHDIGGFEGVQPSPELLVRWVQLGIYSPKFAINCYKTSTENNVVGDVIEPWMYPETTALVRDAIKRRYEILPYIYSLSLDSHLHATPPMRWVGWGYESDPQVWKAPLKNGETQFWFGDSMLVAGVFEAGEDSARVYIPKKDGVEELYVIQDPPTAHPVYLSSGKWHRIFSSYTSSIPVLAKVGTAIPIGRPWATRADAETDAEWPGLPADEWRGVEIFPPPPRPNVAGLVPKASKKSTVSTWYEDDGASRFPSIIAFDISYYTTSTSAPTSPVAVPSSSNSDSGFETGQEDNQSEEVIVVDLRMRKVIRKENLDDDPAERVDEHWRPKHGAITTTTGKDYVPIWMEKTGTVDIALPKGDNRKVVVSSKRGKYEDLKYVGVDEKGRKNFALKV